MRIADFVEDCESRIIDEMLDESSISDPRFNQRFSLSILDFLILDYRLFSRTPIAPGYFLSSGPM
jgi:hypothetical protein